MAQSSKRSSLTKKKYIVNEEESDLDLIKSENNDASQKSNFIEKNYWATRNFI